MKKKTDKIDHLCFALAAISIIGLSIYKTVELICECHHKWEVLEGYRGQTSTGVYLRCKKCGTVIFKKLQKE